MGTNMHTIQKKIEYRICVNKVYALYSKIIVLALRLLHLKNIKIVF